MLDAYQWGAVKAFLVGWAFLAVLAFASLCVGWARETLRKRCRQCCDQRREQFIQTMERGWR